MSNLKNALYQYPVLVKAVRKIRKVMSHFGSSKREIRNLSNSLDDLKDQLLYEQTRILQKTHTNPYESNEENHKRCPNNLDHHKIKKIELRNIDLICVDCVKPNQAVATLKYCQKFFDFGRVVLFTDTKVNLGNIDIIKTDKINNLNQYSDFMLKLINYIDNDYVMVVQNDGHPLNPDLWDYEYMKYDYIGAHWPHEDTWVKRQARNLQPNIRKNFYKNRVGNGGFSLRSQKFLEFSSQYDSCEGFPEDIFLCAINHDSAIEFGIRYAPFWLAAKFSYENPLLEFGCPWDKKIKFDETKHFGWHGKNFINSNELITKKY